MCRWRRPRNILSRQTQSAPKALLDPHHLAAVRLVVVAQQMQNTVKNQELELARERASEFFGIAARGGRRDRDVAEVPRITHGTETFKHRRSCSTINSAWTLGGLRYSGMTVSLGQRHR